LNFRLLHEINDAKSVTERNAGRHAQGKPADQVNNSARCNGKPPP
jgi:hypothetical protein